MEWIPLTKPKKRFYTHHLTRLVHFMVQTPTYISVLLGCCTKTHTGKHTPPLSLQTKHVYTYNKAWAQQKHSLSHHHFL